MRKKLISIPTKMIKILDKNWTIRKLYIPRPFYKFYGGHFRLKYTVFKKAICLLVLRESLLQHFNITCTDATLVFNIQHSYWKQQKNKKKKENTLGVTTVKMTFEILPISVILTNYFSHLNTVQSVTRCK